jgi:electron transfer flavoprotein beta subunit
VRVVVCWKWAPRTLLVDPLTAAITPDLHSFGPSPADQAALEVALTLGAEVTVVSAGPAAADAMLRDALAAGAAAARRCPAVGDEASAAVARAIAATIGDTADLVLCGDYSADRGSGSVPAFLAAELGFAQALGAVALGPASDGGGEALTVERRLDGGRRERLRVALPAVVSVEGAVARLRRAPLARVLSAQDAPIELGGAVAAAAPDGGVDEPYRPRPLPLAAPTGSPLRRIEELTAAMSDREPPRVLVLEPAEAADAILAQLRAWQYLP